MTDLTEKLNAGRLYYVKKKNGKIVIRQAHLYSCLITEKATPYVDFDDNDIEKVMAAVPSFEEWQDSIFNFNILKMSLNGFEKRERRLKGLLKECYTIVDTRMLNLRGLYNTDNLEVYKRESERLKKLLTKIVEVLK